jgi:hypothetical protein
MIRSTALKADGYEGYTDTSFRHLKSSSSAHVSSVLNELSGQTSKAIREGMLQLLEALELARDSQCSAWEFAVEIPSFQHMGIHSSQLRWLIRKFLIDHARETTARGMESRTFEPTNGLSFASTSCFVLTELGEEMARELRGDALVPVRVQPDRKDATGRPTWDADLRELRFQGQVVKRYKVPSPNQQIVLQTFDEESWPCRVDDPLMPHEDIDPKRRLHDTIKSLNRHQIAPLLRFYGDGTGEGVLWGTT